MLTLRQQFGVVNRVGRPTPGRRRFGVPVGGAFDCESLELAILLTGCQRDSEAWELSQAQASFSVSSDGVVAVVGAGESRAFSVAGGDEFTVEAPRSGARMYVAFGLPNRSVNWQMKLDEPPTSVTNRTCLRVVPGPQASMFDLSVLSTPFTVSRIVNRVGLRLEEKIGPHTIELPSEPSCVGAIQVANDGALILIGPDGPTIGGYPKIAVVIASDIDRVGQLAPGDSVRFDVVDIEAARVLAVKTREALDRRIRMLKIALGDL